MTAREVFEAARGAARRIEELQFDMCLDAPPSKGGHGATSPGASDPTGRAAEWRVDAMADMASEMCECERAVGYALGVIEGVRAGLGERYAVVLDRYYIDGEGWGDVSEGLGVARSTIVRWRDIAFDWIDSVGQAHAIRGTKPSKWDEFTPSSPK